MHPLKQVQDSGIFFDNLFPSNHGINHNNNTHNDASSSQDGSQNGDESNSIKKRNRISFVCKACRRSKTKCDREKPKCGRCVQHGIACVYDVEKQAAPRNPSKDATIARLERDVEYWRQKAVKLMQDEEEMTKRSERNIDGRDDASPRTLKRTVSHSGVSIGNSDLHETPILKASRPTTSTTSSRSSNSVPLSSFSSPLHSSSDHVRINLYRSHPSMIMNSASKREVKPLSENYVITQDIFLSGLLTSAFLDRSKNTMLPALSANLSVSKAKPSVVKNIIKLKDLLANQCHTPIQLKRLNDFTDRILNEVNPQKVLPMSKMGIMLQNSFETHYLEDFCPPGGEYSGTLNSFIAELEELLPPYVIIQRYKSHFYRSVFPILPFLDEKSFEDSLQSTLFPHELDPDKVVLRLGNVGLRGKMENLCILLLVLKLSCVSLQITDEASQSLNLQQRENLEKYPISNQSVIFVQKVLAAEKFFSRANENIITCLLYIWAFFVYSPEESDFFLEHPTDLVNGLILTLAMSIGLHRDPSDFPQLRDSLWNGPSIMNHRRMLWVSTVTSICLETSLKGRNPVSSIDLTRLFIDVRNPNALQLYMERVQNDISSPVDPLILRHHEFAFKRLLLAVSILDLDKLTLTYGTFSLSAIEEARDKIVRLLDEHFPMPNFDGYAPQVKRDFDTFISNGSLPMRIIGFLMILRLSLALFLHFESMLPQNPELFPQYRRYFTLVCLDMLTLISHPRIFFVNSHRFKSLPMGSYNATKYIQLGLSTSFFAVLVILIRIDLASNIFLEQYQEDMSNANSESMKMNNEKLGIISLFKKLLEDTLENIHRTASNHLRFTYFSVFKMLILYDIIVIRMKKGELWSGVLKLQALGDFNTAFLRLLNLKFSVDPDGEQNMVEKLKQRNYVQKFSTAELNSVYQKVKAKNDEIPPVCTPRDHGQSLSQTHLTTISKMYEGNSDMGPPEKMSPVASMGQNLNFGDVQGLTSRIKLEEQENISRRMSGLSSNEERHAAATGEYPGLFGGLNLFDYDFLFANNL
ncbi:hypothetical protein ZYGR_0I00310 [Zygosaccharomyces rouxii]|uniref:Zn(2)-C6 fungal-type domain-containing protein n=1 Tax=Zygosaccharomyces rouxii TaxID=4956 RepID=A0A1Q2ZWG3_ZYGRO|nr:hypothetical protein ZYGR_0I00310 [Zygosaccharomyces rouxii]